MNFIFLITTLLTHLLAPRLNSRLTLLLELFARSLIKPGGIVFKDFSTVLKVWKYSQTSV